MAMPLIIVPPTPDTGSASGQPPVAKTDQFGGGGLARSAGAVSAAVLISRLTGLVREMVMANLFGARTTYDSFLLAFRIPNLSRDLFAEGALSSAFVPVFSGLLSSEGEEEAMRLANLVGTAITIVVGTVCVLGMIFAPGFVEILAPGFLSVPGKYELSVHLTRIMFPYLLLIALSAQGMGMLNSYGKFGSPAMASTMFNLGSLGFGLLLGFVIGPVIGIAPIEGMAYGVVAGGALQLSWQVSGLRRLGYRFRAAFDWSHPEMRAIVRMMIPAVIGSAAVQINIVVNTAFASVVSDPVRGPQGPVSWLAYAFRVVQLPLGLFGFSLASATLPAIARSAAVRDLNQFRATLSRSVAMVLLLTIPSSLVLIALSKPLVGAIYQGGQFAAYDTGQTALALSCYASGLLAYAAVRVLTPAFYALSDARKPMYVSFLSIGLNVFVPLLLLEWYHLSFVSLALTTAIAVAVECLCLAELLRRKLGGIEGRYLFNRFIRISAASSVAIIPVIALHWIVNNHLPDSRLGYIVELAILIPVAAAGFFAAFRLFAISELRTLEAAFIEPVLRHIGNLHVKIRS